MGGIGLEHPPLALSKTAIAQNPRAESGALGDKIRDSESDLSRLVKRWPQLPEHIKAAIKALARSYQEDEHRQKENE